ncbi:hypothetical protein BCV69DRAFT_251133 [Microstroma glucosiphilum]|uniref:Glutathione S-transferase n=1 Tax=Pseudomicrostroma glucosiphilum TaxID=1684307 RepID=A0A316U205_9BASI|nr:hypothetical protein BCV69DRAFT_251133 [Pseudomicrostroma glucosiphilum]PWN19392.1 hypothetical protein BCV69DRAFT_251133 [Pseudomicrostroma glucosiphilum]
MSTSTPEGSQSKARSTAGAKGANYHRQCTGAALRTVEAHSTPQPLTLYGAAFCPFVHRVWIALEVLGVPYRYIEVDPYEKPKSLLEVNPKGLVPSLRIEGKDGESRGLGESTVILEYLHERFVDSSQSSSNGKSLLPSLSSASSSSSSEQAVYQRAQHRLVSHHLNAKLIPAFYRFLQAQEPEKQVQFGGEFVDEIRWFQERLEEADKVSKAEGGGGGGDFFGGAKEIGWTDVMLAPWAFRATNVLHHFRSLSLSSPTLFPPNSRYDRWTQAVFSHPAFLATTSTEDLYLDSYARYAENRPNTSQVAKAINEGREFGTGDGDGDDEERGEGKRRVGVEQC